MTEKWKFRKVFKFFIHNESHFDPEGRDLTWPSKGRNYFRISFEWSKNIRGISLGYEREVYYALDHKWESTHQHCWYLGINFAHKWEIKQCHMYYDGPHCAYWFGPFFYDTSMNWCDKCHSGDY